MLSVAVHKDIAEYQPKIVGKMTMKWAELLNLSEQEEECIDESAEPGDGLLIAGNARVPIRGKFPSGNVLYDLFSTNPNETKKTGLGDKKDAKPVI